MSNYKKEKKQRRCKEAGCERPVMQARANHRDYVCCYHFHKREEKRQPVLEARRNQKHNAATRKIPYGLTRRHWFYLNYFTFYWKKKGRRVDSLTIDRIDNERGYTDDNVQVTDKRYNSEKWKGKDWFED